MESSTKREKKTPPNVVELITKEVSKLGQNKTALAMSLPLFSLQKYMTGKTEPTQASLQKIASYFNTSVAWLRGEDPNIDRSITTVTCPHCGQEHEVNPAALLASRPRKRSPEGAEQSRQAAKKGGWPKGRPRKKTEAPPE